MDNIVTNLHAKLDDDWNEKASADRKSNNNNPQEKEKQQEEQRSWSLGPVSGYKSKLLQSHNTVACVHQIQLCFFLTADAMAKS